MLVALDLMHTLTKAPDVLWLVSCEASLMKLSRQLVYRDTELSLVLQEMG